MEMIAKSFPWQQPELLYMCSEKVRLVCDDVVKCSLSFLNCDFNFLKVKVWAYSYEANGALWTLVRYIKPKSSDTICLSRIVQTPDGYLT